jgi:hypothetical protein
MSQYQDLSGQKHYDFGYDNTGDYHRVVPSTKDLPLYLFGKKTSTDRNDLAGKTCPSCGIKRSKTNKCECNS